jgi:uncharacterized RDD family membrane protein YckC
MPYCTKCGYALEEDVLFCPNCGNPVVKKTALSLEQPSPSPTASEPRSGIEAISKNKQAQDYWIRRVVALVIDYVAMAIVVAIVGVIVFLPFALSGILSGGLSAPGAAFWNFGLFPFFVGLLMLLYFPFSEAHWGATFGKSVMGLKVTTMSGGRPTFGQALIRNISKIYWLLLLLDVIVGLATESDYKQKFSDRYAGTVVVPK